MTCDGIVAAYGVDKMEVLKNKTLCVLGDGWGADAVLKGLRNSACRTALLTDDEEVAGNHVNGTTCVRIRSIDEIRSDIVVCSGYKRIITRDELDRHRFLNLHPSLLPKYRGLHSMAWAILNNEKHLGMTLHEMNENIDDGPIVSQCVFENDGIRSCREYMQQCLSWVTENIAYLVDAYLKQTITVFPQDKNLATWVGKRTFDDCRIDFNRSVEYLRALFRVLQSPYPRPFFEYEKTRYVPTVVEYHMMNCETHIGRILNIDDEGLWVKILDGYMTIKQISDVDGNEIDIRKKFVVGRYLA